MTAQAASAGRPIPPTLVPLVMAALIVLAGCGGPSTPSPSSTASGPPVMTPSVAPSTPDRTPAPLLADWQPVGSEALGDPLRGFVAVAAAGGPAGFVIVGDGPLGGVAWFSPDGIAWRRTEDGPRFDDVRFRDAAALGQGFVAVGVRPGDELPVAWFSPDGVSWEGPIPLPGASGPTVLVEREAAASTGALVGIVGLPAAGGRPPQFWTTGDGRAWRVAPVSGLPPSGDPVEAAPWVVAVRNRFLVATVMGAAGVSSTDGTTWQPAARFPGTSLGSLCGGPTGAVLVGGDSVWSTGDGLAWEPVDTGVFGGRGVTCVAGLSFGLIMMTSGAGEGAALWGSTDGRAWLRGGPGSQYPAGWLTGIVQSGYRLVAFGNHWNQGLIQSIVVWRNPSDPTIPAPTAPPEPTCPGPGPDVELADLLVLDADRLADCLGNGDIRFRAFVADPGRLAAGPVPDGALLAGLRLPLFDTSGCPDIGGPRFEPEWLGGCRARYLLLPEDGRPEYLRSLAAWQSPGAVITGPGNGWTWVTGHANDPASATCRVIEGTYAGPKPDPDPGPETCARRFVVTRMEPAP